MTKIDETRYAVVNTQGNILYSGNREDLFFKTIEEWRTEGVNSYIFNRKLGVLNIMKTQHSPGYAGKDKAPICTQIESEEVLQMLRWLL